MDIWKTANEWLKEGLLSLPTSRPGIEKWAKAQAWQNRPRTGRGGGKQYLLSSMPKSVIAEYNKIHNTPVVKTAVPVLSKPMTNTIGTSRADAKLEILRAFNGYLTTVKKGVVQCRMLFANLYNEQQKAVAGCPTCLSGNKAGAELTTTIDISMEVYNSISTISATTIARWQKDLKTKGVHSLAGSYGKNKGNTIIDRNRDIKGFILAMFKDYPHAKAKHIMRGLRTRFNKDELPAYRTLQSWISNWKAENAQLHSAITNPDKWRSKYRSASGTASGNVLYLNQIWEMDGTPADILLQDGKRYNITGCIDVYSRRLKLLVSKNSTAKAVAGCLRKAILDWGMPTTVKTDNGADYVSKHMTRVFSALDIEQSICPPFSPERKPHIERVFKTFSHDILELIGGFVGHNVAERKDIEQRKSFSFRLFEKDDIHAPELTADTLQEFCDNWCNNVYHQEVHGSLNGLSPASKARNYVGDIFHIKDERALDILLLPSADGDGHRIVSKKGISVDGSIYDHHLLGGLEGSRVQILLSDEDWGHAYVFNTHGDFICKAINPNRVSVSREEVATHRRAQQAKLLKEQKQEMRQLTKDHKTGTVATDILRAKAIDTGKVAEFPKPTKAYSNKVLDELANVKNQETDQQAVDTNKQIKQMQNSKPTNVAKLPETPRLRYIKWCALEQQFNDGIVLKEFELRWFELYSQSAEYKAQVRINTAVQN